MQQSPNPPDNTEIVDGLDPAERDARWLRRWYPMPFVAKLAMVVLTGLLALVLAIYYAIGTDWGTRFLLDAIVKQTGIGLTVGEGNLRDGLWVYDLKIANDDKNPVSVYADKAHITIGWKALLSKQVHLSSVKANTVIVKNHSPKSDEPFSYPKVALPFTLSLDDVQADLVRYQQLASDVTLNFTKADIKDFSWSDSLIKVDSATLGLNDVISIDKGSGKIDLQNNYPIDVKGKVHISALDVAYIGKIDGKVSGSLQQLTGKFTSQYNKADVVGEIVAYPLEKNVPFDAKLAWKNAQLPYLTEQNIRLKNATATATGNLDNIIIKSQGDLSAKNIPTASYQGVATTDYKSLKIGELTATLPEGTISSRGVIDWQNRVNVSLMNSSNDLLLQQILPKILPKEISPYVPKTLDGKVAFVLDVATDSEPLLIKTKLMQNDGETVQAVISNAKGKNTPYHILANWQNYQRTQVPNVGDINSPFGRANITYQPTKNNQDKLTIVATTKIDKLNITPMGDYVVKLDKVNDNIHINEFDYQGIAGALSGKGAINLANKNQAFNWQVDANAKDFNIEQMFPSLPISGLTGDILARGVMKDVKNTTEHHIELDDINMLGNIVVKDKQKVIKKPLNLTGKGTSKIQLLGTDLQHLTAKFDGSLDTPDVPKGAFKFDIAGNLKQLNIHDFVHQSGQSSLTAKGKLDLQNGVGWDMTAKIQQFDGSFFAPTLPSNLTGNLATHGYWRQAEQAIYLNHLNITGRLKNQPISATGGLIAKLKLPQDFTKVENFSKTMIDTLKADNLQLQWGNNRINATGNEKQLVASVDISTLNQLVPTLKGMVRGGVVLSQPNNQALPNVMVDLVGRNIALPNFVVLDSKIKGEIVNLGKSQSQLELTASGLNIANQPIRAVQLQVYGTQSEHRADIKTESTRGNLQASIKGAVDIDKKTWQGVLGNGQIGTKYAKLQQLQPSQMRINWQNPTLQLASHCWQMAGNSGKLCLNDNLIISEQQGKVNFDVKNIDSQIFGVVLPNDIAWTGKLNGQALLNWQKNQKPSVNATFYSDNGTIGTAPQSPDELATTIDYERISLIARSTGDSLKLRADVKTANDAGNGYFDATINPYKAQKPIDGVLVFDQINLAILKPFFPAFERFTGMGLIAGKVNGTLNQPKFVGDVEIQDATLSVVGLPMRMEKINILASVNGNQAKVTGDFNTPANGNGLIAGTVDWVNELQAKLNITGDNLQLSQPPLLTAKINPMFDIIVRPQRRQVDIVGAIDIPQATIRPPEASEDVITQSPDVNVIDRRLAGQIDEVLKVTKPWAINAEIGIDLGKNVEFQGFGAKLPLAGALHLSQKGQGSMQARGVVQVAKRSKVEIFGQNLDLDFSQVRFNGAVSNPSINVQATKQIQGVQTGVKVTGQVAKPNIMVFNDGGLTEQQAMNALVTGSLNTSGQNTNEQDFRSRVNNTLAAAGLSFGLSSTRGLTNEIGQAFGLQSLTLDASGTGSDTLISITGYITPDLFIRYGVGVFTSQPELSMRYQLTRRLYIEGKSALNNTIDLIYNWKF